MTDVLHPYKVTNGKIPNFPTQYLKRREFSLIFLFLIQENLLYLQIFCFRSLLALETDGNQPYSVRVDMA